jgi:alpha-1,2-glucosyltransferase
MYHRPQVLAYLGGNFKYWNPKITTPPGLYLFTLPILWCSGKVFPNALQLPLMRAVNAVVFPLLWRMLEACGANADWIMANPFIFPYFFLYYTDALSLLLVVVSWWLGRVKNVHVLSAILGAISLAFRQTNVIWIGLIGALEALKAIYSKKFIVLCYITFSYGLVLLGFGCFLAWNDGSVVLGDKSAHSLTFNLHQLTFWSLYSLVVEPSMLVEWFESFSAFGYSFLILGFFSHCLILPLKLHPYNLQKNCHILYFFFAWLGEDSTAWWAISALLTPIPLMVQWKALGTGAWTRIFFFSALFASTCLSSLVEVRYFAVPWTVFRIMAKEGKKIEKSRSWIGTLGTIDALLMIILLLKKYIW